MLRALVRPAPRGPAPAAALTARSFESSSPPSAAALFAPLILLALLFFAAAAVSPQIVPWPRVAAELDAHRSDLAAMAFGVAGLTVVLVVALFLDGSL